MVLRQSRPVVRRNLQRCEFVEVKQESCASRTVELCRQAGVRFDAIDHSTVLARIIPADARSEELTHAASVFAISARLAALESLQSVLRS